jgi:hypothetical protein
MLAEFRPVGDVVTISTDVRDGDAAGAVAGVVVAREVGALTGAIAIVDAGMADAMAAGAFSRRVAGSAAGFFVDAVCEASRRVDGAADAVVVGLAVTAVLVAFVVDAVREVLGLVTRDQRKEESVIRGAHGRRHGRGATLSLVG